MCSRTVLVLSTTIEVGVHTASGRYIIRQGFVKNRHASISTCPAVCARQTAGGTASAATSSSHAMGGGGMGGGGRSLRGSGGGLNRSYSFQVLDSYARDISRGNYSGSVPAQMTLLYIVLAVTLVLLLPHLLFTPLILSGLMDATTSSNTFGAAAGAFVFPSAALVAWRGLRRRDLRRQRSTRDRKGWVTSLVRALAVLCVSGGLCSFYAASLLTNFERFLPSSLEPAAFGDRAVLVHLVISLLAWRLACRTLTPLAHAAHYAATTLLLNALCCRALYALEQANLYNVSYELLAKQVWPLVPKGSPISPRRNSPS